MVVGSKGGGGEERDRLPLYPYKRGLVPLATMPLAASVGNSAFISDRFMILVKENCDDYNYYGGDSAC